MIIRSSKALKHYDCLVKPNNEDVEEVKFVAKNNGYKKTKKKTTPGHSVVEQEEIKIESEIEDLKPWLEEDIDG